MVQKTVVVGAGPVGALAALYAAQRGHEVEIYELRSDLRDPTTTPLNFTKSINLALSERGINAIKQSGHPELLEKIVSETIPMRGRMIHGRSATGTLFEQAQDYDIHGRTLFAADRSDLNAALLNALEALPNVTFHFSHKLTGANFSTKKAWFEDTSSPPSPSSPTTSRGRAKEIEITFDLLIGADGAHSSTRYHLMKYVRMDYQQEYIDTLWCEFQIEAKKNEDEDGDGEEEFAISPNHLHIWPGKEFMFIAIPSLDKSFTCTLFLPSSLSTSLLASTKSPSSSSSTTPTTSPLITFFNTRLPGVTSLISPTQLTHQFTTNPHLPLISLKCSPYHYTSTAVILGDAAHAMVPFYGQGMNAGLEDVRVLFSFLDEHSPSPTSSTTSPTKDEEAVGRAQALSQYSSYRAKDAHTINDLALSNYIEMRSSVTSPIYKMRKWMEEKISVWVPSLGWATKYSMVSFGNERYSEVVERSERQGRLLVMGLVGVVGIPILGVGLGVLMRFRRGGGGGGWWR